MLRLHKASGFKELEHIFLCFSTHKSSLGNETDLLYLTCHNLTYQRSSIKSVVSPQDASLQADWA